MAKKVKNILPYVLVGAADVNLSGCDIYCNVDESEAIYKKFFEIFSETAARYVEEYYPAKNMTFKDSDFGFQKTSFGFSLSLKCSMRIYYDEMICDESPDDSDVYTLPRAFEDSLKALKSESNDIEYCGCIAIGWQDSHWHGVEQYVYVSSGINNENEPYDFLMRKTEKIKKDKYLWEELEGWISWRDIPATDAIEELESFVQMYFKDDEEMMDSLKKLRNELVESGYLK